MSAAAAAPTSLFVFPSDLVDETPELVFARARDKGQVDGLTIAANYHEARDLFPHNPRRRLSLIRGGTLFVSDARTAATRVGRTCRRGASASGPESFAGLVSSCRLAGLRADGWLNLCHLDNPEAPADVLCRNAFGDPDYATLCPSHPDTARFADALVSDTAASGVGRVVVEALQFAPIVHGFHHERWFTPVSELGAYLLGLCFCEHCRTGAASLGADVECLAAGVRTAVDDDLDGEPAHRPLTADALVELLGDDLALLWRHRQRAVADLVAVVAAAARRHRAELCVVESSGAVRGYLTGRPTGEAGPLPPWRFGFDAAEVAALVDEIAILAYAKERSRVTAEIAASKKALAGKATLGVILRPGPPDCAGAEELAARVALAHSAGASSIAFYHYGLLPLASLAWIGAALSA